VNGLSTTNGLVVVAVLGGALAAGCGGEDASLSGSPFAVGVVDFTPGERAGFGQDRLPFVVLGPPEGGGLDRGSLDVLSLGVGGSVVLELGIEIVDAEGVDFVVFENPFRFGGIGIFVEPGLVAVSEDGVTFVEHACDAEGEAGYEGCAGVTPVEANATENTLSPTDFPACGGDGFDLAEFGVARARFVRIRDAGIDRGFGTDNGGFDLDAIAVVHGE
jgi:hypothetical protein